MTFETRELILSVARDMSSIGLRVTISTLEDSLKKLRRLEDFHNKVIEINTGGPVEARLTWEGGKNVLRLTAKVYWAGLDELFSSTSSSQTIQTEAQLQTKSQRLQQRLWNELQQIHQDQQQLTLLQQQSQQTQQSGLSLFSSLPGPRTALNGTTPGLTDPASAFASASPQELQLQQQIRQRQQQIRQIQEQIQQVQLHIRQSQQIQGLRQQIQQRKPQTIQGFKDWSGTYTVFNGQEVMVEVETQEVSGGGDNCIHIRLLTSYDLMSIAVNLQKTLLTYTTGVGLLFPVDPSALQDLRSFAWSPPNPETFSVWDSPPTRLARQLVDWTREAPKVMALGPNEGQETARHEFGHVLGLGDMYDDPDLWPIGLPGVDASLYPDLQPYNVLDNNNYSLDYKMVMDDGKFPPKSNDIEMVILAFQTGLRQNFQKQGGFGSISEALGKGN